jgi:hypothetical protein
VLGLRSHITPVAAPARFDKDTMARFKMLGLKRTLAEVLDNCSGGGV